ncbi:MAG: protein kinase [Solirubrobacterales bacterium]
MSGGRGNLNPGDMLGDFRILKQIGRGGMGVVYLARDERLERRVALKVIVPGLAADADFRERFIAEARSAAAIDHDKAVPVFSAGVAEDDLYMAMRYIEGTDLRTLLAEGGVLEPGEAVAIVADVAAALDAAHTAGFVHRDVKPANILLRGEAGSHSAYLSDFGLTKSGEDAVPLTRTGHWVGTIDYVAPEQIQSVRVDARTDVYALGCVLYEAIAGSVPYAGDDMQKMWGHVNEPFPTLVAGKPGGEALAGVLARATAKDPDERFPSAGDLAKAATAALRGGAVDSTEHSVATGAAATGLAETATAHRLPVEGLGETVADRRTRPERPEPATRRMASPHGGSGAGGARTWAIVGGAALIAAGLLAAAVVVAGSGSGGADTTVTEPVRKGDGRRSKGQGSSDPILPANRAECTAGVYVEERSPNPSVPYTSCQFAREVARAYRASHGRAFTARSPVTGDEYDMTCAGVETVRCSDGKSAVVYLTPGFSSNSGSSAGTDLGDWPGGNGYSAMLGAFSSEWRAQDRQREASERGLDAGVLYSSNFSSLKPGYWIVFSGSFASSSEAAERTQRARSLGYSDSYPRFVSP